MPEDNEPDSEAGGSKTKSRPEIEEMKEFSKKIEEKQKAIDALGEKGSLTRGMTEKRLTKSDEDLKSLRAKAQKLRMPESVDDLMKQLKEFHANMVKWIEVRLPEEGKWAAPSLAFAPYAFVAVIILRMIFL